MKIFRLTLAIVTVLFAISACDTSSNFPPSNDAPVLNEDKMNSTVSGGSDLENVAVLALGPADGRVVVSQEEGGMEVLKVGDTLPGTNAVIVQVLHDKLVVEDTLEKEGEPPVKQIVWIFNAKKNEENMRIQRFNKVEPEKAQLQAPNVVVGE